MTKTELRLSESLYFNLFEACLWHYYSLHALIKYVPRAQLKVFIVMNCGSMNGKVKPCSSCLVI